LFTPVGPLAAESKFQHLAPTVGKREKERVTPEFGERKEEKKIYPQIQGVT
jgi:hypothetical protein